MPDTATHMTELEGALASPGGAKVKRQYLHDLEQMHWQITQRLRASVPRSDYPLLSALLTATEAALQVLQSWPANEEQPAADAAPAPSLRTSESK